MHELTCAMCGNEVLVEKFSPTHTSVQWLADAQTACPEFARAAAAGVEVNRIPSCLALRDTIEGAVRAGRLATDDLREDPDPIHLNEPARGAVRSR